MKKYVTLLFALVFVGAVSVTVNAQDEIRTLFKGGLSRTTAYGAINNKFTTIDGEYVNMVEVYGGVYINRKVLIGIGGAAATNNLPVPSQFSAIEGREMSYEYGQFGLYSEFVAGSNKAIHPVFHLFAGPGFTVQYDRADWEDFEEFKSDNGHHDENWFMVAEPGVQLEMNVFKWLRFSPGVSYRFAYGSESKGLSDSKLSGGSVNLTLKFGRF